MGNSLADVMAVMAVVAIALTTRLYFRAHRLSGRGRIVMTTVALGLMGLWCLRASEFRPASYCMLAFGAFVLIASLLFLRRFEKTSSENSSS